MSILYRFFELNENIVIFVYGVIFFLMGFGILLKNRQHSRFNLAKSLHWLALFGIFHAFADWGHMFIPIQKAFASEQTYVVLRTVRVIINTLSFMFLLQFGISLWIYTKNIWNKLKYLPLFLFIFWFAQLILYKTLLNIPGDELLWVRVSDIWSRYIIAFPGAFISSYAIILQKDQFTKYGYFNFVKVLYLASISLMIYGIVAGVIVPQGPINLANVVNAELFFLMTGLPIEIIRAFSGLLMSISILNIIRVFDREYINRLQESEKEKAIFEERNRIAQDLHDGIIQSMYATNLQMEVINHLIVEDPEQASEKLTICLSRRNQIINQIREYIGELKRATDANYSLKERITEIFDELNIKDKLKVKFVYNNDDDKLSVTKLYHLTLIIKEALSNVMKHSDAKNLSLNIERTLTKITIIIKDDGRGFNIEQHHSNSKLGMKQGIANIKERVKSLNGQLDIESIQNKGTTLSIEVPLEGDFN